MGQLSYHDHVPYHLDWCGKVWQLITTTSATSPLTCLGNIVPVWKRDWTVTKNVADPARKKNLSVLRHIAMRNRLYCIQKSVIAAFTRTLSMLTDAEMRCHHEYSTLTTTRGIDMGV